MPHQRDQVVFRLSKQLLAKLDRLASKSGRSRSELLREAVEQYVEGAAPRTRTGSRAAEPSREYRATRGPSEDEAVRTEETLERIVRAGVRALQGLPYRATTFSMGEALVPSLDKSLHIVSALEDDETARKLSLRK